MGRLHERRCIEAHTLVAEGVSIGEKATEHALAQLHSSKLWSKVNALDFSDTGTKKSKPAHSREVVVYIDKVEDSLGRWIAAELVNDAWDILTCGHSDYLVRIHRKEVFDSREHPRQVLDIEFDECISMGYGISDDEFVFKDR